MKALLIAGSALALSACSYTAAPLAPVTYGVPAGETADMAAAVGLDLPPPLPAVGQHDLVLTNGGLLDHDMRILGLTCKVASYENQLQVPVVAYLSALDTNSDLEAASTARTINIRQARTFGRCFATGTFEAGCRIKIQIDASVEDMTGGDERTVSIEKEMGPEAGFWGCGKIARALSVVNLHVAAAFAEEVAALD